MEIFEISLIAESVKASMVVNIDMVNPIPASVPIPNTCFQFTFEGKLATFNPTMILQARKIPNGFPITRPKKMPIPTGDVREAMTWEGRRMAVFAKANKGRMKKLTHL